MLVFGGMLASTPPQRPRQVSQAEWSRRISVCQGHAVGLFRDCVRDPKELKKAEEAAAAPKPTPSVADGDNTPPSVLPGKTVPGNRKVAVEALAPYTRKDDPDIFAEWGTRGVRRIEAMRKAAAYAVAKKPECDFVGQTDIADQRSRPPSKIVIMVLCGNMTQYFLSRADLRRGVESEAARQRVVKSDLFKMECANGARSLLLYPSSYKERGGDWFESADGRYGYSIAFDMKNGFGNVVPEHAQCTLLPSGKIKVEIRGR